MSSRESLPVPFFDWRAHYAERAEAFSWILSDTVGSGGFILQDAVADFESDLERRAVLAPTCGSLGWQSWRSWTGVPAGCRDGPAAAMPN
jgi:hypothetical protein